MIYFTAQSYQLQNIKIKINRTLSLLEGQAMAVSLGNTVPRGAELNRIGRDFSTQGTNLLK